MDTNKFLDFLELTLADWLEQVEGAYKKENPLGQAYAYRREQYKK